MYKRLAAYKFLFLIFLVGSTYAQKKPTQGRDTSHYILPVDSTIQQLFAKNRIANISALENFFQGLTDYKEGRKKRVQIVHFGDSHLQMGYWADRIRMIADTVWGLASYGSSFPYQIARYNPYYVYSRALSGKWVGGNNLSTNPEIIPGMSGFIIETTDTTAEIALKLRSIDQRFQKFNVLKILLKDSAEAYTIDVFGNQNSTPIPGIDKAITTINGDKLLTYTFENIQDSIRIRVHRSTHIHGTFQLSGVQFDQQNSKGIVYHNFGVGGSQLNSMQKGFYRVINQLELIQPDLIVISFGSNEAYFKGFKPNTYDSLVQEYTKQLHIRFPQASILFTTPPDTKFKNMEPRNAAIISSIFKTRSEKDQFACWDLNLFMKNTGGILEWLNKKLASTDKLHFTKAGYQLHGNLLMLALLNAYEEKRGEAVSFTQNLQSYILETLPFSIHTNH